MVIAPTRWQPTWSGLGMVLRVGRHPSHADAARRTPTRNGFMATLTHGGDRPLIQVGVIVDNVPLCPEHFRLTFQLPEMPPASPGQFVHLCPAHGAGEAGDKESSAADSYLLPLLRRAFSIAGLRRADSGVDVDVIYRVVGKATRWMATLRRDDALSVLAPLGNAFPTDAPKPNAWLVAGGVGLPPMLWLAESLRRAGKNTVAFCGARRADLLALTFHDDHNVARDASRASDACREFDERGAHVVIATDDGSLGFPGHVGEALAQFHRAGPVSADSVVVYTCGPERMMRFVAEYCMSRRIECHVCMERAMACGTGLCQSCVIPVRDDTDPDGWRYQLCCADGPVFEASRIVWETAPIGSAQACLD